MTGAIACSRCGLLTRPGDLCIVVHDRAGEAWCVPCIRVAAWPVDCPFNRPHRPHTRRRA